VQRNGPRGGNKSAPRIEGGVKLLIICQSPSPVRQALPFFLIWRPSKSRTSAKDLQTLPLRSKRLPGVSV
jgi:hypothetical protein